MQIKKTNRESSSRVFFGIGADKLLLAFLVFMTFSVSQVFADFTVQGDFPFNGVQYSVEAYSAAQASPCDGAADAGVLYISSGFSAGDNTYDDNNDYNATYVGAIGVGTNVHWYICRAGDSAGTSRVYFQHTVSDGDNIELDAGLVQGSASVHNDLGLEYVHVCSDLNGGTELSSVNAQAAADGSYAQYYYMWQSSSTVTNTGGNIDLYIYFDDDTANKCTFDNTKKAGLLIIGNSQSPYNYGVYLSEYAPATKINSAIHADIATNGYIKLNKSAGNVEVVGMTGKLTASPYSLYYLTPGAAMTAYVYTAVDTNVKETITGIADATTALALDVKISGTVPQDVATVETTISGITYSVSTVAGTPKTYSLYIPTGQTPTIKFKNAGSTELFSYLYGAPVGADDVLYINKLSGSVHSDLGATDTILVDQSNVCAGTVTNTQAVAVNPSAGTYTAYFADSGDDADVTEDYYVSITDGSYTTCGAKFQVPAARERTADFDIQITGTVPITIQRVGIDGAGGSDATNAGLTSAYGNVVSQVYKMYVSDEVLGAAFQGYVDSSSNIFFVTTGAPDTELLERTKDLTSNQSVNVSKIGGETLTELETAAGGADSIAIYSDALCTATLISSETVQPVNGGGNDYDQYYESAGAGTYYIKATSVQAADTYVSRIRFTGGVVGSSDTVSITNRMTGKAPTTVLSIAADTDAGGDGTLDVVAIPLGTGVYELYTPVGSATSRALAYNNANPALGTLLLNMTKALSADATFNIAEFSGSISDSFYEGAVSTSISVCQAYTTGVATCYSTTSSVTDAGATDDYTVYFEDDLAAESRDIKFVDSGGYVTWINDATASDSTIDPGDNIDLDLEYKVTGTVPTDVVWVAVRDSTEGADPIFAVGAPNSTDGTYKIYVADNTGSYILVGTARVWDANNAADGGVIEYELQKPSGTDILSQNQAYATFAADKTFDAGKVTGTVPGTVAAVNYLSGGSVKAYTALGQDCGAGQISTGTVTNTAGATETYEIYVPSGTAYYYDFCSAAGPNTRFETPSTETLSSGAAETLNVSAVTGKLDSAFTKGATADIKIYDNFAQAVAATPKLGGTDNSDYDAALFCGGGACAEGAHDYTVFFESGGSLADGTITDESGRTEDGTVTDVTLVFTDGAASAHQFYELGVEGGSDIAGGDVITSDLVNDLTGTVPTDAVYVAVKDGINDYGLAVPRAAFGTYILLTPDDGVGGTDINYTVEKPSGTTVLNYDTTVAQIADGQTFDANKITVATHTDMRDDSTDLIKVYTTGAGLSEADCTSAQFSSLSTGPMGASQEIYFRMTGAANLVVNLKTESNVSGVIYTSCVNTETQQAAAGSAIIYSADKKVSGNLATGLNYIYLDNDNNNANYEVKATVDTSATPNKFAAYWAGTNPTEVKATSTGGTELKTAGNNFAADATFNVAKVTGDTHVNANDGAGADTVEVYKTNTCGTLMSSETETPLLASTPDYTQYFYDDGSGTFYVKLNVAVNLGYGDGVQTYSTCGKSGFALTNEEKAGVNFTRKISGQIPDLSAVLVSWNVASAAVDVDGGGNDYTSTTVDSGASAYAIYVESTLAGVGDSISFYATAPETTLLLSRTKDFSSDTTVDLADAYGETSASLEGATDTIAVCTDLPASAATFGTCTLVSSATVNPTAVAGNDYEILFERTSGTSTYYIQVKDVDTAVDYYSYRKVTVVSAATEKNQDFDGRLYGVTSEAYDGGVTKTVDAKVEIYDNAHAAVETTSYSKTGGIYRAYSDKLATKDLQFSKNTYITRNWASDAGTMNDQTLTDAGLNLDVQLSSGVKVTVQEAGGQKITDATVTLYNCTDVATCNSNTVLATCTHPSGTCTITGTNASGSGATGDYYFSGIADGTKFKVRVTISPYDTYEYPGPNEYPGTNYFTSSSAAQVSMTVVMVDTPPAAPNLQTPADASYTTSTTPDLTWIDIGGDETSYQVQVDNNADFSSVTDTCTTADGSIVTAVIGGGACGAAALTSGTTYYWRVRASDGKSSGGWSEVRSFTVDTTAPTFTSTTAATFNTRSVLITGTTGEAATCRFSTADVAYGSMEYNLGALGVASFAGNYFAAEGANTIYVRCQDTAGNAPGTSTTVAFTVGSVAPAITVATPQGSSYNTAQEISVTTDTPSNCRYSTSDVSYATMGGVMDDAANVHTATPIPGADGTIIYYIRCVDDAQGNEMTSPVIVYYNYDTTSPTYSLVSVSSSGGKSSDGVVYAKENDVITVKLQASETITSVPTVTIGSQEMDCALSGATGTFVTCTRTLDGLEDVGAEIAADGAADSAGNGDTAFSDAGANAEFDFDAPIIVVNAPATSSVQNSKSFLVNVTSADTTLTCKYSMFGNFSFAQMEGSLDAGGATYLGTAIVPSDGTYTLYVRCQDVAGNEGSGSSDAFTVDATAPSIISATPQGSSYNTAQEISVTTDTPSNCRYSTSDVSYATMGGVMDDAANVHTATPIPGADGTIIYYIRCVDDAQGNEMTSPVIVYYNYDTTSPTYTVISTTTSGSSSTYVKEGDIITIKVMASEDLATTPTIELDAIAPDAPCTQVGRTFTCTWTDDGGFADASTPDLNITGGTDAATNTGTTLIQTDVVTVDKTTPSLATLTSTVNGAVVTVNATVSNTSGSTITCRYSTSNVSYASMTDTLIPAGSGSYIKMFALPDGAYVYYVACGDAAGNAMSSQNSTAFTVDSGAPSIVSSSLLWLITNPSQSFSVTTSEAGRCRVSLDLDEAFADLDVNMTNTTSTVHTATLSLASDGSEDGYHVLYIKCNDTLGNTMTNSYQKTFVLDTTGNFDFTSATMHLGWNSFLLPLTILHNTGLNATGNYTVPNVLSSLTSKYTIIYYYNSNFNSGNWSSYVPGREINDLTSFVDDQGLAYWINMNVSARLNIAGPA